jgi:hypothetical protein
MQDHPIESASELSFHAPKSDYVSHRGRQDSISISSALSWFHFPFRLCRWYGAFRSFRAHIRIQSAMWWVDLGPLGKFQDGRYQNHERIRSRAEGIETLRAKCPWVDSVDCRMFLMGFDEGEKWSMAAAYPHAPNIPEEQQAKD